MKPTIGRIVHYFIEENGEVKPLAALITDVKYPDEGGNPQLLLSVFTKSGVQVIGYTDKQGEDPEHWNWIPKV